MIPLWGSNAFSSAIYFKTPVTNHCPFCGNYAYAAPVGDAYRLDCRYCEIQVEITKRAYAARCPNPVAVLDYIREKMKGSSRPRVDIADMKRTSPPFTPEDPMTISHQKQTDAPETDSDLLTTAAKAIGTTLGKIAVKTGIAKPTATAPKVRKKAKAVPKKVAAKPKTSAKKSPSAKAKKSAARRKKS
jgi:hypothetical protein